MVWKSKWIQVKWWITIPDDDVVGVDPVVVVVIIVGTVVVAVVVIIVGIVEVAVVTLFFSTANKIVKIIVEVRKRATKTASHRL